MENYNEIPKTGTIGGMVDNITANFQLTKEMLERLEVTKDHAVGLFSTLASLQTAYPTPEVGDWALVGDTTPFAIYKCTTAGTWSDTGGTYDGGTIDLSDYVKKEEFDEVLGGSKTFALTEGGLFTKSGAWESKTTSTVHCTGYVDVTSYTKLTAVTSVGSSAYAVAFFDSNKNLLPDISIGGGGAKTYNIDLTDATYANVAYAFVSAYNSNADFSAYSLTCEAAGAINARLAAIDERIEEAENDISGIGAQIDGIDSTVASLVIKIGSEEEEDYSAALTETGFYSDTGVYISTSKAMNTGLVSIDGYRVVKYKSSIGTGNAMLAFYDASQNFLPSLVVEGTGKQVEGTIILDGSYAAVKYVRMCCYGSTQIAVAYLTLTNNTSTSVIPRLASAEAAIAELQEADGSIRLTQADFVNDGYITVAGAIRASAEYKYTDFHELKGAASISLLGVSAGESSVVLCFYDANQRKVGDTYNSINARVNAYTVDTIPSDAVYFRCGTENSALSPSTLIQYTSMTERVTAIEDTMEKWNGLDTILINPKTTRPKVLIFGDSISDSAHIKINKSKQTTEYWFADPSNHYTNSQGVTITYYMWPWFVNKILNCSDCRCYAMSGASYRTIERTEGNERQNLQFQIDLAMNDLTNPLSVFPTVGTYNPDIVIFALGINDGVPTTGEDYATTMAKTVFVDGGIDVDATIAAMDYTNRADAVHGAFLRTKKAFPYALTFAVLPIQTKSRDVDGEGTMNELIRLIAHRYSIHVIDGARDMGIVRDFCGDVDIYLKDGLHPNDKGQNLYTRLVLAAIRKEYINLSALNQ